jgi:hypothetical protein
LKHVEAHHARLVETLAGVLGRRCLERLDILRIHLHVYEDDEP